MQRTFGSMTVEQRRARLQAEWKSRLGNVEPTASTRLTIARGEAGVTIAPFVISPDAGVPVACTLLQSERTRIQGDKPIVVMFARAGKQKLLSARRNEIAAMLDAGFLVCLTDLRGFGETSPGSGRDRGSDETAIAASYLMLGDPLIAGQLRDLRAVLHHFDRMLGADLKHIVVWGDSLAAPNPPDVAAFVPEDLDQPTQGESSAAMVALLAGLFDDVAAVYTRGGLASYRDLADKPASHVPLAAIVPGVVPAGDVSELVAALSPKPVRQDAMVDTLNRLANPAEEKASPAAWIIEQLKKK
jgi:pimeloyl-ACP methyl ester carboxylesterase